MTPTRFTYLDYAASAPLSPVAREAEAAYEKSPYAGANPNSLHSMGRLAARALDEARKDLVRCLGGGFRPSDVTFTSGGTESNNLALLGLAEAARAKDRRRTKLVLSAIEHDSILDVVPVLRDRGFEVALLPVTREGLVSLEALKELLDTQTALVSVMSANNETGIVQPIDEVAQRAHAAGALIHTDAVQAFGRIPLALNSVDAVSIAAHKIGGPLGIGALVTRSRVSVRPQSFGGGQEWGRRAGTQDVRSACAFAAVAQDCCKHRAERAKICEGLAKQLIDELCCSETGIETSSAIPIGESRLPGIVSLVVPQLDSETLVLECDQAGYAVSAASACSSASLDASHVLLAMGVPREQALCSLRISFDERVTRDEISGFITSLKAIIERRGRS